MRDRLIELLDEYGDDISFCDICDRPSEDCEACKNEQLADYLISKGVTFQTVLLHEAADDIVKSTADEIKRLNSIIVSDDTEVGMLANMNDRS